MALELDDMINWAYDQKASDLFLRANTFPAIRQHGKIAATPFPMIDEDEVHRLCYTKLSPVMQAAFEEHHEMDLAFSVGDKAVIHATEHDEHFIAQVVKLAPAAAAKATPDGKPAPKD